MTTDWNSLLDSKKKVGVVCNFAHSEMSGRDFYSYFKNTASGGAVRGLLRDYGVSNSKRLARQALSRRGFTN